MGSGLFRVIGLACAAVGVYLYESRTGTNPGSTDAAALMALAAAMFAASAWVARRRRL